MTLLGGRNSSSTLCGLSGMRLIGYIALGISVFIIAIFSLRDSALHASLHSLRSATTSHLSSPPPSSHHPFAALVQELPQCFRPLTQLNADEIMRNALIRVPGTHREIVHFNVTLVSPFDAAFDIIVPILKKENEVEGTFDYVTDYISNGGFWEGEDVKFVAAKMHECNSRPDRQYQLPVSAAGQKRSTCTFVDVGANLGWYSIVIGSLGYPVIAFEANPLTYTIIQSSLNLAGNTVYPHSNVKNVKLIPFGVGELFQRCTLYSLTNNIYGSTTVHCTAAEKEEEEAAAAAKAAAGAASSEQNEAEKKTLPGGYEERGDTFIVPADCYLADVDNAYVMKIDVEGFEIPAFRGMKNFLRNTPPVYILAEFTASHLVRQGFTSVQFVSELTSIGYNCWVNQAGTKVDAMRLAEESDEGKKFVEGNMVCEHIASLPHNMPVGDVLAGR